ncbi:MAG: TatD family hydrolase [bacterium]|nr:TatD family hydrolase [bacterium]
MYVDAHTHLDFYGEQIEKALREIEDYKILTIANSMDLESYMQNKSYGERCSYVIPAFGIHPWKAGSFRDSLTKLIPWIEESRLIGEIGLDTVWAEDPENYERQQEVYHFLLKESMKRNKVITIHTKGAEEEIYESLKGYDCSKVIIHWYSGDIKIFEKLVSLGCYFTVSVDYGISLLTQQLVSKIPMDRLLVETDGPTALEWVTGEYGYPSEILRIVERLAECKQLEPAKIEDIIWSNFCQLMEETGI